MLTEQPFLGHDLRPWTGQECRDDAITLDKIRTHPDFSSNFFSQQVTLRRLQQGVHGAALGFAVFPAMTGLSAFKVLKQCGEMLGIAGVLFREQNSHLLQVLHELGKVRCVLTGIGQTRAGHRLKQTSRGMLLSLKKNGDQSPQVAKKPVRCLQ